MYARGIERAVIVRGNPGSGAPYTPLAAAACIPLFFRPFAQRVAWCTAERRVLGEMVQGVVASVSTRTVTNMFTCRRRVPSIRSAGVGSSGIRVLVESSHNQGGGDRRTVVRAATAGSSRGTGGEETASVTVNGRYPEGSHAQRR